MSTLSVPQLRRGTICATCSGAVSDDGSVVLGDLVFHSACVPTCEVCGASLAPEIQSDWSYQVLVVSSPFGYEQVPYGYRCVACQETWLTDEPPAQD